MLQIRWQDNAFRLLALFIAIVLWIYVTNQTNPIVERAVRVSLESIDLAEDMVIHEMPASATIYYKSTRGRLPLVDTSDFKAWVNLDGLDSGTHSVSVQVDVPPGINVDRVSPDRVNVTLDRIIEKELQVALNIIGAPAAGYHQLEPVIAPRVVTAKGPSRLLEDIERVSVTVDIREADTGMEQVVPVSTGVEGVELQPNSVKVVVPIEPFPVRAINVSPRVRGEPAEGYIIENIIVEPNNIQVTGPANVLDRLQDAKTQFLDVSGANKDINRRVEVLIPQGASSVNPIDVQVTVIISPDPNMPENGEQDEDLVEPGE